VVRRLIVGVAILATAIDLIMIYGEYRVPLCPRTVACLTDVGGICMVGRFIPAVTGLTRTVDLRVIHTDHRDPCREIVARFARSGGVDMGD
jgi:hypothetical protein